MLTHPLVTVLAIGALAAVAAPAAADCWDDECRDARARSWSKPRFEGGFGLLAGTYRVSTVSGAAVGMHVDGGVRMGRLALLGEYAFLSIGENAYDSTDPIQGVLHRGGVNARYSGFSLFGRCIFARGLSEAAGSASGSGSKPSR